MSAERVGLVGEDRGGGDQSRKPSRGELRQRRAFRLGIGKGEQNGADAAEVEARPEVGILGIRSALLVGFGAIRPYKGFERLIDLSADLGHDLGRPVHVIVAGPTMAHAEISDLERRAAQTERVTLSAGPVPDNDVQLLFEAADVIALPYRKVMNSGVLMLGLTFGRTCVAPENPITTDAAASGLVELFDAGSDDMLLEALRRALTSERPDELPEVFQRRYDPSVIAGEFAGHLATIAGNRTQV